MYVPRPLLPLTLLACSVPGATVGHPQNPGSADEFAHEREIIEPHGFVIAQELHVVDMAEHVAVPPARRNRGEKPETG